MLGTHKRRIGSHVHGASDYKVLWNSFPLVTYPNKVGPSVLYDSSTRNLSHYCGRSKITGRMYTETDFVRLEERNPNGTGRRFTCADDYAGNGDKYTNWVITVNGDNHVFNRDVSLGATCFKL